ncbi:MAG: hypothetical protein IJ491_00445 [Clostridia bacterium]|nr:hypothetical protein [Clostridia bacterium]
MKNKSFEILSADTVVAVWNDGELTIANDALLPLYLKRISNAEMWLESRAIDSHRANSRLLKKALRLAEKDDVSTVVHVNGATITDNYWVRPVGSELTYADIKFDNDYFSNLALKGTYDSFNRAANSKHSRTPELTNVGSFEKCWKIRDGKWWMYKRANHNELFSEMFVFHLGEALGMNMALYERGQGVIKSLDFTDSAKVNFEPASTFMGDNEDYEAVIAELQKLYPEAIGDYVRMIFLDTVVANPDRHTNNFGLFRDINTGLFIGFAPNFDNNMALISRGYPKKSTSKDLLISIFNELLENHPEYKEYLPQLKEETVRDILDKLNMKVKRQEIIDLVINRYNLIAK